MHLFTPQDHVERGIMNKLSVYGPTTGRDIMIREEYHTLYKLPNTQAILFTVRTYQRFVGTRTP